MSGGSFGAAWVPAAAGNFDGSRATVDLIVVHHTACTLAAAIQRFQTPGSQVSAHFIVGLDGSITEMVDVAATAYHSGDYATNRRSVGIEHESVDAAGNLDVFTDAQYAASAALCAELAAYFGFPLDSHHLWPHNRVVATSCPGSLDLSRLIQGDSMTPEQEAKLDALTTAVAALDARVQTDMANLWNGTGWPALDALKAEIEAIKSAAVPPHSHSGSVTVS